jgi:hypothetical protein
MKDIQDRGSIPLGSTSTVSGVVRTHGVDKTRIGIKRSTESTDKAEKKVQILPNFSGAVQVFDWCSVRKREIFGTGNKSR